MSCWLTSGFFSLIALQGLLLAASLGAVAVKFVRDPAGRTENEFLLDASRQIAGTFWAALVADPVRGLFTGLVAHDGDECAWYWVELVADATIGVWLAYRAMRLYLWGFKRYLGPQGAASVWSLCRPTYFDEEGKPNADIYGVYAEQLALWLVALTTAKLVLAFGMIFEAVQVHALLRATLLPLFAWSGHQEACLVVTCVVMQSVQYCLVDDLFLAVHGLVPDDPARRRLAKRSPSRLSLLAGGIRSSLSLGLAGPLLAEEDDEEAALAAQERLATLQSEAREAQEQLQRALEERASGAMEVEAMREQARAKKAELARMSAEYQEEERRTRSRAEERARLAAAKSAAAAPARPESEQQAKKKGCLCGGRQPDATPRLEPVDQPVPRLEPVAPPPGRSLPWSAKLPEPFTYASASGAEAPAELPGFAELRAACGLVEADFQAAAKELLCKAAAGTGAAARGSLAAARLAEGEAKTFRSIRDAYLVHVRLPANSTGSRFGSFLPRYYGMYIHQNDRATYVIKANPFAGCRDDIVERLSVTGHQGPEILQRSDMLKLVERDRKLVPVDEAARDSILAQLERDTAFLARQPRPEGLGVPGGLTGYAFTLGVVPFDTVKGKRALDMNDETRDGREDSTRVGREDSHKDPGEAEGQEAVAPSAEPDDDAAGLVLTETVTEKVLLLGDLEPIRFDSAAAAARWAAEQEQRALLEGSAGCDPDEPQLYRTRLLSVVRSALATGTWLEELPELHGGWGEVPPQLADALPEPQREEAQMRRVAHEEESALLAAAEDDSGATGDA